MPLLLAIVVAIAGMPNDVYKVCAWNVGTAKVEPWRSKLTAIVARPVMRALARLRALFSASGGLTGLPAQMAYALALAVVLAQTGHAHAAPVMFGIVGVKDYRQRDADLRSEVAKLTREKSAIGEKALIEKRAMTDEERASFATFTPKIDALDTQIQENGELLRAAEAALEAERNFAGVRPDPDVEAAARAAAAGGLNVPRVTIQADDKMPGFFGRQLQAVRKAAFVLKGGDERLSTDDQQLLKPMRGDISAAGPTGMNSDVPSEGGFLVQTDRAQNIIQRSYAIGQILSRVTQQPIGPQSDSVVLPAIDETSRADNSRYGGITSGWLGQGLTISGGKPKFRQMTLKLRKVGAFVYSTDELIKDAVALEGWINRYLPMELMFRTEDAYLNGDGSNKPQGALNSGAVLTVTRKVASHVVSDDMRGMWNRMYAPNRMNSVWLIDQTLESDLDILSVPIGMGGQFDPSYKPAGTADGQVYATYKNRPIIPVEYMQQIGTQGDLALVDLSEYTYIDKGGPEMAVSLHVAFLTDEAVWRFIYRVDGQLNWNKPLTPKSGGPTLSPVIVLQ
jgi:HK97 family phage major capsid protein